MQHELQDVTEVGQMGGAPSHLEGVATKTGGGERWL